MSEIFPMETRGLAISVEGRSLEDVAQALSVDDGSADVAPPRPPRPAPALG